MREIGSALYAFMDKYLSWIDKPKIGVTDVIEIDPLSAPLCVGGLPAPDRL